MRGELECDKMNIRGCGMGDKYTYKKETRVSLVDRVGKMAESIEEDLNKQFDTQIEDIKTAMVRKAYVRKAYIERGTEKEFNFVKQLDLNNQRSLEVLSAIRNLEEQRSLIKKSGRLLSNLVDTGVIYETLTFALRELKALDEEGELLDKYKNGNK